MKNTASDMVCSAGLIYIVAFALWLQGVFYVSDLKIHVTCFESTVARGVRIHC